MKLCNNGSSFEISEIIEHHYVCISNENKKLILDEFIKLATPSPDSQRTIKTILFNEKIEWNTLYHKFWPVVVFNGFQTCVLTLFLISKYRHLSEHDYVKSFLHRNHSLLLTKYLVTS